MIAMTVMKQYSSFKEIKMELRQLTLEREIAKERLKGAKLEIQSEIESINWLKATLNAFKKYGALLLLRKLMR